MRARVVCARIALVVCSVGLFVGFASVIGVLLLILGVMVACTDVEVRFVRWFNCGPLSTPNEQTSEVCS